jgi:hypothetical protein
MDLPSYFRGMYDMIRVMRIYGYVKEAIWLVCVVAELGTFCLIYHGLQELKAVSKNTAQTADDIRNMRNELRGNYEEENELKGAFGK